MDKSDELIHAEAEEKSAIDKVVRSALSVAGEEFNDDAADPGWAAEMYDEQLTENILLAAGRIVRRRAIENTDKKLAEAKARGSVIPDGATD